MTPTVQVCKGLTSSRPVVPDACALAGSSSTLVQFNRRPNRHPSRSTRGGLLAHQRVRPGLCWHRLGRLPYRGRPCRCRSRRECRQGGGHQCRDLTHRRAGHRPAHRRRTPARAAARHHLCARRDSGLRRFAGVCRNAQPPEWEPGPPLRAAGVRTRSVQRSEARRPLTWWSCAARCCPARRRRSPFRRWKSRPDRRRDATGPSATIQSFLREGSSVHDFYNPPKIVIGEASPGSGDPLAKIYERLKAPAHPDLDSGRRDGQVRGQRVSRAQDHVRQRDRQSLQAHGDRQPRGHVDLLPGHPAQPLACLPAPGLRVRRLLPSQGPARADVSGQAARPREPRHQCRAAKQPQPLRRGRAADHQPQQEARSDSSG